MSSSVTSVTLVRTATNPTNQIDFDNISEQYNYFSNLKRKQYLECKYQSRSGTMIVRGYIDDLKDFNYGFYTNSYNGTTKTYYFWILSKNSASIEATELTIAIDTFQTWLFDIKFAPCFIERAHVVDDTIGRHTCPESFELGDYIAKNVKTIDELTAKPCFIMGLSAESNINQRQGIFGRLYSGLVYRYYDYNHTGDMSDYIQSLCDDGKGDAIAMIFSFPDMLMSYRPENGTVISGLDGKESLTYEYKWDDCLHHFAFRNHKYTPYNNKLFIYPYNFITIKNSDGGNVVLKFEQFTDMNDIEFKIEGVVAPNPIISCTPISYGGKTYAYEDSISISDWGLCSWNNDNYANWFAQNRHSINAQSYNASASFKANNEVNENNYNNAMYNANIESTKNKLGTIGDVAGNLGGLNIGGAIASGVTGYMMNDLNMKQAQQNANTAINNANLLNRTNYQNTIRSMLAQQQDAKVQPNSCRGNTSGCGLDLARESSTFYIEQTMIKPESAYRIDMYFQMYGYQINSVEQPTLHTREKWNYIKTVGCHAYGTIPFEDINDINATFDNGLTIWHKEKYMFNYDTENPII